MIDQNRDGFIDKEDLHDMLASLGKNPEDAYLEGMMNEAPGPINFTMFLTLFGERLQGTDPEDVIKNAFACFDEDITGNINEEKLRELLTTMGDRFTDEDVSWHNSMLSIYKFLLNTCLFASVHFRLMTCIVKHPLIRTVFSIISNLPEFWSTVPKTRMTNDCSHPLNFVFHHSIYSIYCLYAFLSL